MKYLQKEPFSVKMCPDEMTDAEWDAIFGKKVPAGVEIKVLDESLYTPSFGPEEGVIGKKSAKKRRKKS